MKAVNHISVLVVGDLMLDKYIFGRTQRISQEAPVPVLDVTRQFNTLGGAGNVVANLAEIGVDVKCVGAVGTDVYGDRIRAMLDKLGIDYYLYQTSQTTTKTRLISDGNNIQIARYDHETFHENKDAFPLDSLDMFDAVIISDYGKGMVTCNLSEQITHMHDHVLVDPFPAHWVGYKDAFIVLPNQVEYDAIDKISQREPSFLYRNVLRKNGKHGMILYEGGTRHVLKSERVPVFNVSGAGDTVIAAMSVCMSMGMSLEQSARVSRICAEYVVAQPGTACVPKHFFGDCVEKNI